MTVETQRAAVAAGAARASGGVLISRIFGLLRETLLAAVFGASREYDAFLMAFRIPNLLRDLFAEGALSQAFVKVFKQTEQREGDAHAFMTANRVLSLLVCVLGGVCLMGMTFSNELVGLLAPGFQQIAGKSELTAQLAQWMFPFIVLVSAAAVAMGMLNSKGYFGLPQTASAFFNIGSIGMGFMMAWWWAPAYVESGFSMAMEGATGAGRNGNDAATAMRGMAVGVLFGGACQLCVQLPALWKLGWRYRPSFTIDHRVREVLRLMGPAVVGAAAVQINVAVINSNYASYLGDKPISWLNYAFRFMQFPIGMFGVAVAAAAMPEFASATGDGDMQRLRRATREALALVSFLCVPAAVGLAVIGEPLIGLIYEHGRFSLEDTAATAMALQAYALGLAGYAGIKVLQPALVALDDARTPMLISVASVGVNLCANHLLVRVLGFGHVGLACSTSVVALVNCAALAAVLRHRAQGTEGGLLMASLWRIGLAAALMGGLTWMVSDLSQSHLWTGRGVGPRALQVGLSLTTGVLVFAGLARLLRIAELDTVLGVFRRRLRR
jgi:putative peptidoglycan lipid II flippase